MLEQNSMADIDTQARSWRGEDWPQPRKPMPFASNRIIG